MLAYEYIENPRTAKVQPTTILQTNHEFQLGPAPTQRSLLRHLLWKCVSRLLTACIKVLFNHQHATCYNLQQSSVQSACSKHDCNHPKTAPDGEDVPLSKEER